MSCKRSFIKIIKARSVDYGIFPRVRESNIKFLASSFFKSAPQPVLNLSVTETRATEVDLDWDDLATLFDDYTVYVQNVATGDVIQIITGIQLSEVTVMGLSGETQYEFWVRSVRDGIESAESNHVTTTTLSECDLVITDVLVEEQTLFYTDFSEYLRDEQPNDWTKRWVINTATWEVKKFIDTPAGSTNDTVLRFSNPNEDAGRTAFSWDILDGVENKDVEILARFQGFTGGNNKHSDPRYMVRGSGLSGSERGYVLGQRYGDTATSRLRAFLYDPSGSSLLDGIDFIPDNNVWALCRIRIEGTSIKIRSWQESDPEPATWQIEITDATISEDGWIGLQANGFGSYDLDFFQVKLI